MSISASDFTEFPTSLDRRWLAAFLDGNQKISYVDSQKKSTTIQTVKLKHAALFLTAAWILWNHTTNPDSSQETWTPLSQFKTESGCIETARGIVKKHISTPRSIEGSALISPKDQPQKLLVYIGDKLVSAISYECTSSAQNPRLVSPSP
jgi:hypothetical protein